MSFFDRFRRPKKPDPKLLAAYEKGKQFGDHLATKLQAFVDGRMAAVTVGLLEVFKSIMDDLPKAEGYSPQQVATAQLQVFAEKISEAHDKMWAELMEHFSEEIPIAKSVGMVDQLGGLIEKATAEQAEFMALAAKSLYEIKIKELNGEEKT